MSLTFWFRPPQDCENCRRQHGVLSEGDPGRELGNIRRSGVSFYGLIGADEILGVVGTALMHLDDIIARDEAETYTGRQVLTMMSDLEVHGDGDYPWREEQ